MRVVFFIRITSTDVLLGETADSTVVLALRLIDEALEEAIESCGAGVCSSAFGSTLVPLTTLILLGRRPTLTATLPLPPGENLAVEEGAPRGWSWEGSVGGEPLDSQWEAPVASLSGAGVESLQWVGMVVAALLSTVQL